ncbi:MAG TPA: glycosyltransferase family 39 protein [Ktedonobacteraceae bacterium]
MKSLRGFLPAAGVFGFALLIRIIYNVTVGKHYLVEYDAHYYYDLAVGMIKYHCYCSVANTPSITRAPLWPYIMYSIFSVLGTTQDIYARLFLSVLGSGTCVIVYLFARDIFGHRIALITGAIAAVYPGLFINDGWLYSESVYTFFLTTFAYSLYRFQRNAQRSSSDDTLTSSRSRLQIIALYSWPLIAGVSLALSAFTRLNGPLLLAVVFVWALIVVWKKMIAWQIALRGVVIIAAVTAILIAPWTMRNYTITHKIIPIAMGSGMVLTGAYNNTVLQGHDTGMWVPPNEVEPPAPNADSTSYSVHWIRGHLQHMPFLLSLHFLHTWVPYTPEPGLPFIEFPHQLSSTIVYDMIWIMTPIVILMALLGLIFTWKRQKSHLLIAYLVLAMTILQNIAFYGSSRFRSPIEPLLVLLTGGVIWWFTNKGPGTLRSRKRKVPQEDLMASSHEAQLTR